MTAGSWIYIGSQGILQGTYETFAELARQHFGGTLRGRVGAHRRPRRHGRRAAAGGDPERRRGALHRGRSRARASDASRRAMSTASRPILDEALAWTREAATTGQARVHRARRQCRGRRARVGASRRALRRRDRPDLRPRRPERLRARRPARWARPPTCGRPTPTAIRRRSMASMADQVRAMLALQRAGAVVFDYGNNIRAQAQSAGVADAFAIPGFVPEFIRPQFCEGRGRSAGWRSRAIRPTSRAPTRPSSTCSRRRVAASLDRQGPASGWPTRDCRRASAGWATASGREAGLAFNELVRSGAMSRAHRHRPRPSRRGLGGLAEPRDRGDARRLGRHRGLAAC